MNRERGPRDSRPQPGAIHGGFFGIEFSKKDSFIHRVGQDHPRPQPRLNLQADYYMCHLSLQVRYRCQHKVPHCLYMRTMLAEIVLTIDSLPRTYCSD